MSNTGRLARVRGGVEVEDPPFGGALDDAQREEVKAPEVLPAEGSEKVLSAEDILGADDVEFERVPVPEWGGVVILKTMSAADAIRFHKMSAGANRDEAIVQILAYCACDESGNLLFTTPGQVEKLRRKNIKVFKRLQDAAMDLNGFNEPGRLPKLAKND